MKKIQIFVTVLLMSLFSFGQTAETYFERGNAKYVIDDYEGAIADFTKAIEINPNYAKAYFDRGNSKLSLNDYSGAVEDYEKAVEIEPDNLAYISQCGEVKLNLLNDYTGAIYYFNKLISIDSKSNYSHDKMSDYSFFLRGVAKHNLQDYRGAIADYSKAIEIDPNYAEAYFKRGNAKYDFQDYKGAIADYSRAIEINPRYASDAYYNRGLAKIILGQIDSGCMDLSKAGELGFEEAYDMIRKFCN